MTVNRFQALAVAALKKKKRNFWSSLSAFRKRKKSDAADGEEAEGDMKTDGYGSEGDTSAMEGRPHSSSDSLAIWKMKEAELNRQRSPSAESSGGSSSNLTQQYYAVSRDRSMSRGRAGSTASPRGGAAPTAAATAAGGAIGSMSAGSLPHSYKYVDIDVTDDYESETEGSTRKKKKTKKKKGKGKSEGKKKKRPGHRRTGTGSAIIHDPPFSEYEMISATSGERQIMNLLMVMNDKIESELNKQKEMERTLKDLSEEYSRLKKDKIDYTKAQQLIVKDLKSQLSSARKKLSA